MTRIRLTLSVWALLQIFLTGTSGAAVVGTGAPGSLFLPGSVGSLTLAPHHADGNGHPTGKGQTHYYAETDDEHHFTWGGFTPTTPGTLTIKYDFRNMGGYANRITQQQKNAALLALDAWSAATGGRIVFSQDTTAPASQIINIGTGNLKALGYQSGPGGTLGLGGAAYLHNEQVHIITSGIAWMDVEENWDTGSGTGFDYFTVVAQEIGHALGLGHVETPGSIMYGFYSGKLTGLSATDIEHITSIYGMAAVPLPAGAWLLASGLAWLLYLLRGRTRYAGAPPPGKQATA